MIDSGLVNPRGLAVDSAAGKLYWTDYGSDRIQRANLDGSEVEDLVTAGLRIPLGSGPRRGRRQALLDGQRHRP